MPGSVLKVLQAVLRVRTNKSMQAVVSESVKAENGNPSGQLEFRK